MTHTHQRRLAAGFLFSLSGILAWTQREHLAVAWEYRHITIPVLVCFLGYAFLTGKTKIMKVRNLEAKIIDVLQEFDTTGGMARDVLLEKARVTPKQLSLFDHAIETLIEQGKLCLHTTRDHRGELEESYALKALSSGSPQDAVETSV